MAATVTAYQQYGFSSPEELDEACSAAYAAMQESLTELKQMEKTLNGKKELQRQVLAYSKTRPVRDGLKQQKNAKAKAAYRQKHESDFIIADAAARYFRENGISKLPSYKALQAEIETLTKRKTAHTTITGQKSPCQGAAYREKQSFPNPARRERQREKART